MKKRYIIPGVLILVLLGIFYFATGDTDENTDIVVEVEKGDFEITVSTTGELDPINSVNITGPRNLRATGIREVKIDRLVPEGTVVSRGDFIADLDKSELYNKFLETQDQYTREEAQYTQTKLDTALQLREARDQILNLQFAVEEKEIQLEQSAFEPPATIKQAEIELEKAKRDLRQAKENYQIKLSQARARMVEATMNLNRERNDVNFIKDMLEEFRVIAPQDGMVIYYKSWNGKKIREGSSISTWSPVVATLPDLSTMISKTYVNEVDIMKIQTGQKVKIGLDAFPEKKLNGEITEVANVGEQKPNSDAKVFEVNIIVQEKDTTLRPAMTTSNTIVCDVLEEVLYLPLECFHNESDSVTFVYKKEGIGVVKQEVILGKTNENQGVVEAGLKEGDDVYLSVPSGAQDEEIRRLELGPANIASRKD